MISLVTIFWWLAKLARAPGAGEQPGRSWRLSCPSTGCPVKMHVCRILCVPSETKAGTDRRLSSSHGACRACDDATAAGATRRRSAEPTDHFSGRRLGVPKSVTCIGRALRAVSFDGDQLFPVEGPRSPPWQPATAPGGGDVNHPP
jgi:hypothetical protein